VLSPSWKANSRSPSQEIPLLLWNPNVPYPVQESLPLDPILTQANQVRILKSYLSKINFNIILTLTSMFPKRSLPFSLSDHLHGIFRTTPPVYFVGNGEDLRLLVLGSQWLRVGGGGGGSRLSRKTEVRKYDENVHFLAFFPEVSRTFHPSAIHCSARAERNCAAVPLVLSWIRDVPA
jgi:hypothetical protein